MNDLDLYNACMNFCQVFTMFLLKKQGIENNHFIDEDEKNVRLRHYKGMVTSQFEHLYDVVNSFDGDLDG